MKNIVHLLDDENKVLTKKIKDWPFILLMSKWTIPLSCHCHRYDMRKRKAERISNFTTFINILSSFWHIYQCEIHWTMRHTYDWWAVPACQTSTSDVVGGCQRDHEGCIRYHFQFSFGWWQRSNEMWTNRARERDTEGEKKTIKKCLNLKIYDILWKSIREILFREFSIYMYPVCCDRIECISCGIVEP